MKVIFIHNAIPEYRIAFFTKLSSMVDLDILVTDKNIAHKIYGLDFDKSKLKISYLTNSLSLGKIIKKGNYDIVVFPPIDNLRQLICSFIALIACILLHINFIYWTEKWIASKGSSPIKKRVKNWIQSICIGFFAKRAAICIASGSQSKTFLNNIGVNDDKVEIAYDSSTSPIQKENIEIRSKYKIPQKAKIILYLGRIVRRKGCDKLIEAFIKISQHHPDTYLLICGEGSDLEVCKRISNRNKKVIYAGKIQPNLRALYYAQSDVFVLPSYNLGGTIEAWGLTINESLEQGTPVVTTTAVGAAYDLCDGICSIMVEDNNIQSLSDGIITLLESDNIRTLCKQRYKKFDVENMAKRFNQAFQKIV